MLAQNTQKNAGAKATQTQETSDFSSLLAQEFKSKTEQSKTAVQNAVKTLAEQALANSITISYDAYKNIESIIAEIDLKMSEQINLILHHKEFQQL
ncbi:TPA: type VI secretion system contractile sheath large subunit, partial [Salmonella enterica]